jgi:protein SCO1/2
MTSSPRRAIVVLALLVVAGSGLVAATKRYPVKGMVVSVDRTALRFTASIDAIPNYMRAMTMPFDVRLASDLDQLVPGAIVEFSLVVDDRTSYAENVRVVRYQSVEQDPFTASRLALLGEIVRGAPRRSLAIGDTVPDFTLTDQKRRPVRLADFRGKVVAVNFVYTSCALPNFCLRLANNFNVLQKRFTREMGRDLVLLTVTFDPVHDTPEVMATYAAQWKADAASWRFLTGPAADIRYVCQLFGVQAFVNEGLIDHSLHTALIDRDGKLVANIEGNQFTATQLGDLTASVLRVRVTTSGGLR